MSTVRTTIGRFLKHAEVGDTGVFFAPTERDVGKLQFSMRERAKRMGNRNIAQRIVLVVDPVTLETTRALQITLTEKPE